MVWGMFSWHILGPLIPINHRLNATAYLIIFADRVHPFMATVHPSSNGHFQYNAPLVQWSSVAFPVTGSDSSLG